MIVSYDIEKIKKIIDDLHLITGLSLGFMDNDFNYLYRRLSKNDSFCNMINSLPEGRKRCLCSDYDMTRRCKETMKPVSHVCHAGLVDTTVPIVKQGVLAGFIIIGRIRRKDSDGVAERLSWLEVESEKIAAEYEKLFYFSSDQLDSLIDVISNIIFENSISIKQDNVADALAVYIEKHLCEDLSTGALCHALFVSKNKLYEAAHQRFGMTVNEYVTERRIEKAKRLLLCNDRTVSDIAEEVGVDNYPYFSNLFKKKCGLTPTKFRKKYR